MFTQQANFYLDKTAGFMDEIGGVLGQAGEWAGRNPGLTAGVLGGIGGGLAGYGLGGDWKSALLGALAGAGFSQLEVGNIIAEVESGKISPQDVLDQLQSGAMGAGAMGMGAGMGRLAGDALSGAYGMGQSLYGSMFGGGQEPPPVDTSHVPGQPDFQGLSKEAAFYLQRR